VTCKPAHRGKSLNPEEKAEKEIEKCFVKENWTKD